MESFDNIWKLVGVPVITVQLRYNGWVTEMQVLLLPASTIVVFSLSPSDWISRVRYDGQMMDRDVVAAVGSAGSHCSLISGVFSALL